MPLLESQLIGVALFWDRKLMKSLFSLSCEGSTMFRFVGTSLTGSPVKLRTYVAVIINNLLIQKVVRLKCYK